MSVEGILMLFLGVPILAFSLGWGIAEMEYRRKIRKRGLDGLMEFKKSTYRRARRLAINNLTTKAHLVQWAKDHGGDVEQARKAYFDALHAANLIVVRGRREKGLWPVKNDFRLW